MAYHVVVKEKINELLKKFSLSLIILAFIFFGCLAILFIIADMVFEDHNFSFDEKVFTAVHPYINDINTSVIQSITFLGSVQFLVPANILLILFFLLVKKERKNAWKVFLLVVSNTAVLFFLKSLLHRERPLVPLISKVHGYSFPSGHTFSSVVFFGTICYVIYYDIKNPWVKWLLILLLILLTPFIGFSRIYLRLHYASDVIAGFLLGIIWLLIASFVLVKKE